MMIESVMSNPAAAAKVINADLVQRIMSILKDNKSDPAIALSCLRVLEKVGKTDAGLSTIQQCGGEELDDACDGEGLLYNPFLTLSSPSFSPCSRRSWHPP